MDRGAGRRVDVRPRGALTFAEVRALPRLGRVGTSTLRSWLAGKALGLLPPHDGRRGVALYPLAVVQALPGEARPRTRAPSKPRRRARKGRAPSYGLPPGWEAATSLVARLGLDSVRRLRELARRWNEAIRSSPWPALPVVDRDDPVALAVTQLNATRRVVDGRLRWVFRALAIEFAVQHAWRPPTDLPWRSWTRARLLASLGKLRIADSLLESSVADIVEAVRYQGPQRDRLGEVQQMFERACERRVRRIRAEARRL